VLKTMAKKKSTYIIYMVINLINNKIYIGQTVGTLKKRITDHLSDARLQKNNMYFHKAIRKYEEENFVWKIVFKCKTMNMLNAAEIFFVNYYSSNDNKIGYNLTEGGCGSLGFKHSDTSKQKISKAGKNKTLSKKHKLKISKALSGKNNFYFGKFGKDHPGYKRQLSKNEKQLLSTLQSGENNNMYGKCYGNSIRAKAIIVDSVYYSSIRGAAEALNISTATIHRRLKTMNPRYRYFDDKQNKNFINNKHIPTFKKLGKDNPNAKPVIINEIYYDTMTEAAKALNVVTSTVSYRIKVNKPGYKYAN
jgi:group I intron endonuclease